MRPLTLPRGGVRGIAPGGQCASLQYALSEPGHAQFSPFILPVDQLQQALNELKTA